MEPLFENTYQLTPGLMAEYTKCMTGARRIFLLTGGILYLLFGLFFPRIVVLKILLFLLGIMFLWLSFGTGGRLAKKRYKIYELTHTGMGKSVSFYPDRLECVNEGESARTFYYSQISRVKESQNLYVLVIEKTVGVIVKKDAFQKGNFEEFQKFMKQGRQP